MKQADLIIQAGAIVTVDADDRVLEDHSLVVCDGRIADLLPHEQAMQNYQNTTVADRRDSILMPGLINTHCHLAMNLLRGYADDLPLKIWLQEHIWPAEGKWVDPDFVKTGTELALAESLLGGVTCVNDMYFYPDQVALAAQASGMRAMLGLLVLDFPTVWAKDADDYIGKGLALHDQLRDTANIYTAFAPHAPYTVSRQPLLRIATLAAELDIPVHMHVHETQDEVAEFEQQYGQRPLAALDNMGLLSPALLAVHMTQLTEAEIERVAASGTQILHCPESNLKLASGACPIGPLQQLGVNVALGTDGAASNNDLDMFGEMRSAALLAKHETGDAATMPAAATLRMATINGAKALGIQDETGSLEVGKAADCITLKCDDLNMLPMYDVISHLVYCANRQNVADVWVAGRALVENRELLSMDKNALLTQAREWSDKIRQSNN